MVPAETNAAAVRAVMIDGRAVFRDDRSRTFGEPALAAAATRPDAPNAKARHAAEAASALIHSVCPGPCGAAALPTETAS